MPTTAPTNPRVTGVRGFANLTVSTDMAPSITYNDVQKLAVRGLLGGTTPPAFGAEIASNRATDATAGLTAYVVGARIHDNRFSGDSLISQRFFDGTYFPSPFFNSEIRDNGFGSLLAEGTQVLVQNNEFLADGAGTGRCLIDALPYAAFGLPLRIQTQGNQVVGPAGPVDQSSMAVRCDLATQAPILYGKSGQNVVGALGTAATRPVNVVDAADADIPAAGTPNWFSDATDVVVAGIPTLG